MIDIDGAAVIQLKHYRVYEHYPYFFIHRLGCILPLPFKFINENNAFGAACKLDTGQTTVAEMYFYNEVVGNRPRHTEPLKFEKWFKQNKDYFDKWEITHENV